MKHTKLAKSTTGTFGRSEYALLGTGCATIQQIAAEVTALLSDYRVAYVDADHQANEQSLSKSGFALEYTDKIAFHRYDYHQPVGDGWQQQTFFRHADIILVNGNHFAAQRQIILLDRRKTDSLHRKLGRCTEVRLLLTDADDPNFYQPLDLSDEAKLAIPNWATLQVLDRRDTVGIARFLQAQTPPAPLAALLLAGGKSTRMGTDKAQLQYQGAPHWQYVFDVVGKAGVEARYISCRPDQTAQFGNAPVVADTFLELGPMGAILSAFREHPDKAWLVLACDLPLLDAATIDHLIRNRCARASATAFRQPDNPEGFPEPLVAIWEPKAYPILLQALGNGISCPRKVLINSDTHAIDAPNPATLLNANTPEERDRALELIAHAKTD
jgi:molybdenum cofactor guanylyltransferase